MFLFGFLLFSWLTKYKVQQDFYRKFQMTCHKSRDFKHDFMIDEHAIIIFIYKKSTYLAHEYAWIYPNSHFPLTCVVLDNVWWYSLQKSSECKFCYVFLMTINKTSSLIINMKVMLYAIELGQTEVGELNHWYPVSDLQTFSIPDFIEYVSPKVGSNSRKR